MNRLIQACKLLNLDIIEIKYNDFDDIEADDEQAVATRWAAAKLAIDGMTCAACTTTIERSIASLEGIDRISISLPLGKATVVYDTKITKPAALIQAVEDVGYSATLGNKPAEQQMLALQKTVEVTELGKAFQDVALLSSLVLAADQLCSFEAIRPGHEALRFTSMLLGTWVILWNASYIHSSAWSKLAKGGVSMDILISLSLLLALALSFFNIALYGLLHAQIYFGSGSFLELVILGGRYLDVLLQKQANASFASLYQLQSESSLVLSRKHDAKIPAVLLRPQDEITIDSDSIVPCDCYVIEGSSLVDQSTMSGESMPVMKAVGDFLMSGTKNLTSELVAAVSKNQQESSLQLLIDATASATEQNADDQGVVDTMLACFVSTILLLAATGFLYTFHSMDASTIAFSVRLNIAFERAMAVLAAACPCALGLATPSAVMAGLDAARLRGVIITGGLRALQALSGLTHMVMDKTGTLTEGRLYISACQSTDGSSNRPGQTTLMLLCAAERNHAATHPVAHAVFQWSLSQLDDQQKRAQNEAEIRETSPADPNHSTRGISCEVRLPNSATWVTVHIGGLSFLEDSGISANTLQKHFPQKSDDAATIHYALDYAYQGQLDLHDTIRPSAPSVVSALTAIGIKLTMLTGDVESEANRVSSLLKIPVLSSATLPHQKASFISSLRKSQPHKSTIAMLGDGLNDTPAFAAADVGICLSSSRSFAAAAAATTNNSGVGAAADVAITSPDLMRVAEVIHIAKITMRQARFNVFWVVGYNIIAVALAMGAVEHWGVRVDAARASILMAVSSSSVLGLGLWLRRRLARIRI